MFAYLILLLYHLLMNKDYHKYPIYVAILFILSTVSLLSYFIRVKYA